jgi:phospholipase C
MNRLLSISLLILLTSLLTLGCQPPQAQALPPSPVLLLPTSTATAAATPTPTPTMTPGPVPTAPHLVPDFAHIVIVIFENKEFGTVIGNPDMPYFNLLANTYTLLTQYYAITHPSLPNYISLISGDPHGILSDCQECFVNAPSLPDFIEQSGRTWKTYQDDMPEPCYVGGTARYMQHHNPFIYFDSIRLDAERCRRSLVPLTELDVDLATGSLPNYSFITPDVCYSSHDCSLDRADGWLKDLIEKIFPALEATQEPYLIVLTWDEGQGEHSCCGLPESAGGRVATILISPQAKPGFQDATPYSHYSLLKTIAEAWGLPYLGHAVDAETDLILAPWK